MDIGIPLWLFFWSPLNGLKAKLIQQFLKSVRVDFHQDNILSTALFLLIEDTGAEVRQDGLGGMSP